MRIGVRIGVRIARVVLRKKSVVSVVVSSSRCHANVATQTLPRKCCHANVATQMLPHKCCHTNVATQMLPRKCCHANVATQMLPRRAECCHANVATQMLPRKCCLENDVARAAGLCSSKSKLQGRGESSAEFLRIGFLHAPAAVGFCRLLGVLVTTIDGFSMLFART